MDMPVSVKDGRPSEGNVGLDESSGERGLDWASCALCAPRSTRAGSLYLVTSPTRRA